MAEHDVPSGAPAGGAAPVPSPQSAWAVLFGLFGAGLTAFVWASEHPAKSLAMLLWEQARTIGFFLAVCVLAGTLVRGKPLQGLRLPFCIVPLYLVGLFPPVAAMTGGWEGGWLLGLAGAAAGAVAGAATGWLFVRWVLPDTLDPPGKRARAILLPVAFAVLFALYGVHNWAVAWLTVDDAWVIGMFPVVFALLGALVGRPLLGMLSVLPVVLLQLVPLVASMTAGWEGGWICGIAGAAAGAAAGAVNGWLYDRWIMPEYDKRRARESAARPPSSTAGPGSIGSMADQ